ncbi:Uncharacterized metalloenzyme YdcJ, glyoxalase superfamily [Sphingomonas sp. YR710]|nr:Uncharacterized metalloenzyme YdcJ, glyoxalase superfamily [Sphingomonas sp. YR710]
MSDMYRAEVPQYGTLLALVDRVNRETLARDPALAARLDRTGECARLSDERHGAIRLGTPQELALIARAFAIMNMVAVGYYDLAAAGIPVHSTAFRPVDEAALRRNPFRVFTSLLRLELIEDPELRAEAAGILDKRQIFTDGLLLLIAKAEREGGLDDADATSFVGELLETFRWHAQATVDEPTYGRLLDAHRLIADIVSFKGPHINHLTPRTIDIDAVQAAMPGEGIVPKEVIEGPPRRNCPVLLRQTSFKALDEAIAFPTGDGGFVKGRHTARFGEVEQRGVALTAKGRALYDALLAEQFKDAGADAFARFPDDWTQLRREGLAFFRYSVIENGDGACNSGAVADTLDAAIAAGQVTADPIIYEDFLPVSAAGIFRSNLGDGAPSPYRANADRTAFEAALGAPVKDEIGLYAALEAASRDQVCRQLGVIA